MNESEKKCICRSCPSYVDCGEAIAFCVQKSGKSGCIEEEIGCVCPSCLVQKENNFTHIFYCTKGSEKEIIG